MRQTDQHRTIEREMRERDMPLGSHTPSGWGLRGWLPGALSDSSRAEVEGQMDVVADTFMTVQQALP